MEKVFGSAFRANLKEYMNKAETTPLLIERRDSKPLVLLSEEEYNTLLVNAKNDLVLDKDIDKKINALFDKRMMELEKLILEKNGVK